MALELAKELHFQGQMSRKHNEVPPGFITWGEKHSFQESRILEGSYLRCLISEVFTPVKFYVLPYDNFHALEDFMQQLQVSVTRKLLSDPEMNKLSLAVWNCIYPGMYVLCIYQNEWYRAMVTSIHQDYKFEVEVSFIDYGGMARVRIDDIRYMRKGMLDYPAQAVQCTLVFPDQYAQDDILTNKAPWPLSARHRFVELINHRFIGVRFNKRSVEPLPSDTSTNLGLWEVKVSLIVKDPNPAPLPRDVNAVMRAETQSGMMRHEYSMELRRRIRFLNQIDRTLGQHPDGEFATTMEEEGEDISTHFHYFFNALPPPASNP